VRKEQQQDQKGFLVLSTAHFRLPFYLLYRNRTLAEGVSKGECGKCSQLFVLKLTQNEILLGHNTSI
jgi:hypothetical protein